MQGYSFEILDCNICIAREVICDTDSDAANRAAFVALTIFLLKRPELKERLRILVRDAEGTINGECSASQLKVRSGVEPADLTP